MELIESYITSKLFPVLYFGALHAVSSGDSAMFGSGRPKPDEVTLGSEDDHFYHTVGPLTSALFCTCILT